MFSLLEGVHSKARAQIVAYVLGLHTHGDTEAYVHTETHTQKAKKPKGKTRKPTLSLSQEFTHKYR